MDRNTCSQCNNTSCALCVTSDNNCTLDCNSGCKECGIDGFCISCDDGKFLDSNGAC